MALRTVEQSMAGLRDGRRVYVAGRRVADVTTDPMLGVTVAHSAEVFALAERPDLRGQFVYDDPDLGEPVSAYFRIPRTAAELRARGDLIEENTRQQRSTFNITKAVGTDALLALLVVAPEVDRALGTGSAERVGRYRDRCARRDATMALAQMDVKGDRSLRPSQQADPDLYVRVVDRRADGIVVRGAKAHITAGRFCFASEFHEMMALLQDVAGGLAITGPTGADLRNPETGPLIEKYLADTKGVGGPPGWRSCTWSGTSPPPTPTSGATTWW
jgi:aromatic ring hydroxylase